MLQNIYSYLVLQCKKPRYYKLRAFKDVHFPPPSRSQNYQKTTLWHTFPFSIGISVHLLLSQKALI